MKCYIVCLFTFLSSFITFWCVNHPIGLSGSYLPHLVDAFDWIILCSLSVATISIHYRSLSFRVDVIVVSAFLGCWMSFAVKSSVVQNYPPLIPLYVYIGLMCSFHFLEFLLTSVFHPFSLSLSSFLLNQSHQYIAAFFVSVIEYLVELYIIPTMKESTKSLFCVGLCIAVAGDMLRKTAMIQAGSNFTHLIQSQKRANHKLVTTGVYGVIRHPTYTGWSMFAVGSQIMLRNPFCVVLFAYAAFEFFVDRVEEEEFTLINFFGYDYIKYKATVPSGLPFIKGAQLSH